MGEQDKGMVGQGQVESGPGQETGEEGGGVM